MMFKKIASVLLCCVMVLAGVLAVNSVYMNATASPVATPDYTSDDVWAVLNDNANWFIYYYNDDDSGEGVYMNFSDLDTYITSLQSDYNSAYADFESLGLASDSSDFYSLTSGFAGWQSDIDSFTTAAGAAQYWYKNATDLMDECPPQYNSAYTSAVNFAANMYTAGDGGDSPGAGAWEYFKLCGIDRNKMLVNIKLIMGTQFKNNVFSEYTGIVTNSFEAYEEEEITLSTKLGENYWYSVVQYNKAVARLNSAYTDNSLTKEQIATAEAIAYKMQVDSDACYANMDTVLTVGSSIYTSLECMLDYKDDALAAPGNLQANVDWAQAYASSGQAVATLAPFFDTAWSDLQQNFDDLLDDFIDFNAVWGS